jgi:hypothetical protein
MKRIHQLLLYCLILILTQLIAQVLFAQPGLKKAAAADSMSLTNELHTLYDISALPQYRNGTVEMQTSSYDTTGGNDDGFNGTYSFISRNTDSSLVIFDVQGAGVINRIWTPTPTADTLDFYFDGNPAPGLSIKFEDLFSNKVFPFVHPLCGNELGGYYCYFPILFQNGCKIICRAKKIQFHQIQYRLYVPGTRVKTFSSFLNTREKEELSSLGRLWNRKEITTAGLIPSGNAGPVAVSKTINISAGQAVTLFNIQEGGRITGLELEPASAFAEMEKRMDIRIVWDDESVPALYCPVADFFGYAFGKPSMQSLLLGSANNRNYCYFPMPFDKHALIQLIYRKGEPAGDAKPLAISARLYYTKRKRLVEKEGKFYACWNRYTEQGSPHVFLDAKGKGHYVGSVLQAQGRRPGMTYFFEGDDSTVADGRLSMHGTGSEDYFNGGWYALPDRWDRRLSLPIHGCLDYSLPFCRTGGYRLYLSDKIPFEHTFFQSIEHGPAGNNVPVDYTSLGLYYCNSAPSAYIKPSNALSKVYMPDTLVIYPQLMNFTLWGDMSFTTSWTYNTGGLSYNLNAGGEEAALRISMAGIPYGKYRLLADYVENKNGCSFSFWQGQSQVSGWIQGYRAAEEQRIDMHYCSDIEISEFKNSLTIQFKTEPGKSNLIFNRLILVRKNG